MWRGIAAFAGLTTLAQTAAGAPVPDFQLLDVNANSPRYQAQVSPRDYQLQVSGFYFGAAHCGYCNTQLGYLNAMASELRATNTPLHIEVLGINQIGDEAFNAVATGGRVLPWLQDTTQEDIRAKWQATWRDVFILDGQNQVTAVYNLTVHDLTRADNRAALKQLFLDAARWVDSDKDQLPDDWELRYFHNLLQNPGDDPDGDSRDNFTEYAFGTDPTEARSSIPIRTLRGEGGARNLVLRYRRPAGATVRYFAELSSDLSGWLPLSAVFAQPSAPVWRFDGTGTAEVTLSRLYWSDPVSSPTVFVRLRAEPVATP